ALEKTVERMELLVDRITVYSEQVRLDLRMAMHVRRQVVDLFSMWLTQSDDGRRRIALESLKNRAEKEVGPWFWRRRKEVDLESDLRSRIIQLKEMGYSIDWQWDLVNEVIIDWEGEADEELLKKVFLEAHDASAK